MPVLNTGLPGVPTGNILQPGNISITGGANRALVSQLQLLTPQYYKTYVEKYGNEDFTWWLATYAGMEQVMNRDYFWFENRGKLMIAVTNNAQVTNPAAGATVAVTLSAGDHFNSGTQSPARAGETVRVASSNIEGEILSVDTSTPNAHVAQVRPKQSTQAFISAGSTHLLANEILIFGGDMDAGEASDTINPLIHLDQKYTNTITEMRDTWSATDLAEMTEVFYQGGISGDLPAGAAQAGTSMFTYKGLVKANMRFKNYVEDKLMRGDVKNNTGLTGSGSVGAQGFIPKLNVDAETIGYTPNNLDISKIHEITRVMDVNGCAKENLWLQDLYQRQNFSDGLFKEFPAGAWIWGQNDKSEEAALNYGAQSLLIDNYLLKVKKYKKFNTEVVTGKTPTTDAYRYFGIICPQGETYDAKDASKKYKNMTIMFQQPVAGGTIGNGIRVWEWGGGSRNPTNGKMSDNVEMICYRSLRIVAANQFIMVQAA